MDFIKIEAFLTSKPTNNEVKGKLYIVRKHSQHISDKEFTPKYIKNSYKSIIKDKNLHKWPKST